MPTIRILLFVLALGATSLTTAHAAATVTDEGEDWRLLSHVLALVQQFTHIAAHSADRQSMEKGVDAMLSGQDAETNRHAVYLIDEMFRDMPAEHRGTLAAIGRNLASIAKRDRERTSGVGGPGALDRSSKETALQARRDLHAMGLRYHDSAQLLDAVRRGDALAVELFVLARGVNLSARDADGYSALELARRAGNEQMATLLRGAINRDTARPRD